LALWVRALADRFGRKVVLVGAVLLFGAFSLASAYSTNVEQLLVLRFLTGLGLGAGMPNATTLLSEYTPERKKSLLVTSMFCGFNLGMAGGGFISAKLIPAFGWHSLLLIGGILPLILAVVLLVWLPESARYLVVRNRGTDKVRKTLSPIDPVAVAQASSFSVPEQKTVKARNVFAVIFSGTYSVGTLLLWLTYFMGLVIVYLLTSWLPTLMRDSGASMEQAAFIGALFQFGGVLSAVAVGWAMDRFNPHKVIGTFYLLAGVFAYAVGQSLGNITLLATLVLVAGCASTVRNRRCLRWRRGFIRPRARHRCVVDARHWPLWRDSRGVDGRDVAGPGLELRAGADGAGDSGGVGDDGGGDQRWSVMRMRPDISM
jgi:AAHS family 4-hydroxybenzoate transporter-like MFS transporter